MRKVYKEAQLKEAHYLRMTIELDSLFFFKARLVSFLTIFFFHSALLLIFLGMYLFYLKCKRYKQVQLKEKKKDRYLDCSYEFPVPAQIQT